MPPEREATAADVLAVLDVATAVGADVWLDGGWGVDALLGAQTRRHRDVDLVVEHRHVAAFVAALAERRFVLDDTAELRVWNPVLRDAAGRLVDLHVVRLDERGDGWYGAPGRAVRWPTAEALTGRGRIAGRPVRCTTAASQVAAHTGYPVDAEDFADVSALCARFRLPLPADYASFLGGGDVESS